MAASLKDVLPPAASASEVHSLLARLQANMFSLTDEEGSAILGCGCYPQAAVLNHSCAPNCVLNYGPHGMLHVRATRNIDVGEELCHSYIDLCMPTHMRRRALHNRYYFECDCSRCIGGSTYKGEDVDFVMEAVVAGGGGEGDEGEVVDHEAVDRLLKVRPLSTSRVMTPDGRPDDS